MRRDFWDSYSGLDSPIHRANATVKLGAALVLVTAIMIFPPRVELLGAVAVFLSAVAWFSGLPWKYLLGRVILLEPFVLGVACLALFQPGGWRLFFFLIFKCTLCLLIMVLLAGTTPFSDLLRVFKILRVPALLVTTVALMYRYLFVVLDEAQRMKRARLSRTFEKRRAFEWRTMASVVGQLFIRSSERAERIYAAMCARGWQ